MASNSPIPLYLFAKSPVPGKVKTRMQTHLTPDLCAALAAEMLLHSVESITRYWPGVLVLCVTPNCDDPYICEISKRYNCEVIPQIDADLGGRMMQVLEEGIKAAGAAVVMGCDVPHISRQILVQASAYLQAGENIIGPAEDGGFYLLGLRSPCPDLFEGVTWGGDNVSSEVLRRAELAKVTMKKLPVLRDIDRWEDLKWLGTTSKRYSQFLVNTGHA